MHTTVSDKLLKIAIEIEQSGSASLTRLTVLKKWFEQDSKRLNSFTVFIARQALAGASNISGEASELFQEAGKLLQAAQTYDPKFDRNAAEQLYCQLREFQNEYQKQSWCQVRIIHDWGLFLIEDAFRIFLWKSESASDGYHLAAAYCRNYDSRYGTNLNGPSLGKIQEITRFIRFIETIEDADAS